MTTETPTQGPTVAEQIGQFDIQIKGAEARIKSADEVRERRIKDADDEAASQTEAIKTRHKNEQATELEDIKSSQKTAKDGARDSFKKASGQWNGVIKNFKKQKAKLEKANGKTDKG